MIPVTILSVINRCFLCNRTSNRIVWHENGIDGRLCDCGLLYADISGQVATMFDPVNELHPESFYAMPAKLKARWMAAHCPKGKLLEVGCGKGAFLAAARGLGYEIAGLEPHQGRAWQVSHELGVPVERAFVEEDTLPPGLFDVVYHCDLLAHFPDPLRALSSMTRLLKPGGVLCFEVGILGGISPFWYRLIGEIGLGPHLFLYSFRAMANLMARAGLEVRHQANFGLAPQVLLHRPLWLLIHRVLRPFLSAGHLVGIQDPAGKAESLQQYLENALRYRIGSISPLVGPATVLIVATPRVTNGQV